MRIISGCFVLALFLAGQTMAQEPESENPVRAGMKFMEEKDYDQAFRSFLQAKRENPDVVELDFMLGMAASGKGDYETAIVAFVQVMKKKPTDRVKLELARACIGAGPGRLEQARALFSEVLLNNPPEGVANNIRAILARMEQLREIPHVAAQFPGRRPGHSFGGRLAMGFQYDTNPRSSPSSEIVSTVLGNVTLAPAVREDDDFVRTYQANLYHLYRFACVPLAWKTDTTAYASFLSDHDDLDAFFLQARTGLAFEGERFGSELLGRFNYFEQDYKASLRSWGFEFNNTFAAKRNWILTAGWRHDVKIRQQQSFRNATNDALTFGSILFLGDRHRISAFTGVEWERANYKPESYDKVWAGARYDLALPHDIVPYVGYRFAHSEYDAMEPVFGKIRRDNEHEITVGVRKTWWQSENKKQSFDTDLSYTYNRTYSNLDINDYKRNALSLICGLSF